MKAFVKYTIFTYFNSLISNMTFYSEKYACFTIIITERILSDSDNWRGLVVFVGFTSERDGMAF